MFTGIIEDIGSVHDIRRSLLSVVTRLDDIRRGDSVAVNGVCLTATTIKETANGTRTIDFDFSPETARRTNLELLRAGTPVNLERALKCGGRIGGHFVSGHIDSTAQILKIKTQDAFRIFTFSLADTLARYVVPKGSIAVDGISLTVADVAENAFSISVIPHTIENTVLKFRKAGDTVNLEPDILAKYVERARELPGPGNVLTRDFLARNGF